MSRDHYRVSFPTNTTLRAMATQRVREQNLAPGVVERQIDQALDSGTPADVGPIQHDFTGRDAQFWWAPVLTNASGETAQDMYDYRVIVKVGGVEKRTEFVRSPSYVYTYEKNVIDNPPSGATTVEIEVRARTQSNKLSATPSVAIATNSAPSVPAALAGESWASSLRATCAQNSEKDVTVYRFQISQQSDFSSVAWEYAGPSNTHVFSIDPGTDYYLRVRAEDIFGQASGWATAVLVPGSYVGEADLDGQVFQITPSSSPAPSSGALSNLFDLDTATGATFGSAGWVEYKYPVEHVFSMVRLHLGAAVNYYVQYHDGAAWQDILGSAASPIAGVAGWNIQKFPRQIKAKRLRVQFTAGVTINEAKFWTYLLADEILGQTMTLTQDLKIQSADGKMLLTEKSMTFYADDGVTPLVRQGDVSDAQDGSRRGFIVRSETGETLVDPSGIYTDGLLQVVPQSPNYVYNGRFTKGISLTDLSLIYTALDWAGYPSSVGYARWSWSDAISRAFRGGASCTFPGSAPVDEIGHVVQHIPVSSLIDKTRPHYVSAYVVVPTSGFNVTLTVRYVKYVPDVFSEYYKQEQTFTPSAGVRTRIGFLLGIPVSNYPDTTDIEIKITFRKTASDTEQRVCELTAVQLEQGKTAAFYRDGTDYDLFPDADTVDGMHASDLTTPRIVLSDTAILSAPTERSTISVGYEVVKRFQVQHTGQYRVKFYLRSSNGYNVLAAVVVGFNGIPPGGFGGVPHAEVSTTSTVDDPKTVDLYGVGAGAMIEIWLRAGTDGTTAFIRDAVVCGSFGTTTDAVLLD